MKKPLIIDVREPDEYTKGHVAAAQNLPLSELKQHHAALNSVVKNEPIIVYCRSGKRSAEAIGILKGQGFKHLTNGVNQETVEAEYL